MCLELHVYCVLKRNISRTRILIRYLQYYFDMSIVVVFIAMVIVDAIPITIIIMTIAGIGMSILEAIIAVILSAIAIVVTASQNIFYLKYASLNSSKFNVPSMETA
mmetsp:Transcript_1414/g.2167  ORF Transcript_1414/g.2167 Transcript_1414/m.2167 type:complete len:106 (+) Transcript_1414:324-641(+)